MLPTLLPRLLAGSSRARRPALVAAHPAFLAAAAQTTRLASSVPAGGGTAAPSPRRLGDILRLDLLAGATGAEVASIWTSFHDTSKTKEGEEAAAAASLSPGAAAAASGAPRPHAFRLGTTLPAPAYATFATRASASPLIALPIPKDSSEGGGSAASLTLVAQAQLPHILISTLAEYREAGPSAPAHAIITHYDDLAESKGVVLVRTDLVSPAVLSPAEGARLVETLHALYLDDTSGHALVRAFNHDPATFDWGALCKHLGVEAG